VSPRITFHALQRMTEMGVTADEVRAVIAHPVIDYPCDERYPGRRIATGDRIAVCYTEDGAIVTVLWRTYDAYTRTSN
jgi:hypothetical protein